MSDISLRLKQLGLMLVLAPLWVCRRALYPRARVRQPTTLERDVFRFVHIRRF